MTRLFITCCSMICLVTTVFSQQDPYYAHFMLNQQAYNPAAAGITDDYICISAVGHNQWLGYDDQTWMNRQTGNYDGIDVLPYNVAPTTYNLNISGQFVLNGVRVGGIGLSIVDDRLGSTKTTSVKTQLSYFIQFRNGNRLAIGGEAAVINFGFVNPQFRPRQLNDPRIPTIGLTKTKPDYSAGLYYQQPRFSRHLHSFYVGMSIQHINQTKFKLVAKDFDVTYQLKPHYYLSSGLTIPGRSGLFDYKPSMLIKYNSEPQVNVNLIAERNKQYRVGIGYRQGGNTDAIIAYLGYMKQRIVFGYSYDITTSRIKRVSAGTHEIALKWCIQKSSSFYHKTPREM